MKRDKGKSRVVIDKPKYDEKMVALLSDLSTYKVSHNDPTPSLQRRMNSELLKLKKDQKITPKLYSDLRCSSDRIPSIYGLPKVHKSGIPMRPIVSFYTSPTFNLSKHLVHMATLSIGWKHIVSYTKLKGLSYNMNV